MILPIYATVFPVQLWLKLFANLATISVVGAAIKTQQFVLRALTALVTYKTAANAIWATFMMAYLRHVNNVCRIAATALIINPAQYAITLVIH